MYNHTLSSTFSHPSLPLIHHSQNWSCCSHDIRLPTQPNAIAISPDESLLAVAAGSDVLIYHTEGDMKLSRTLQGHMGWVTDVAWFPGDGSNKLVSSSSMYGRHREEVVRFWDLNEEPSAEVHLDLGEIAAQATANPVVVQAGLTADRLRSSTLAALRNAGVNGEHDVHGAQIDLNDIAARTTATAAKALVSEAGWTDDEISATSLERLILSALSEAQVKRSRLRSVSLPGTLAPFGSSPFSPDGSLLFYRPTSTTVAIVSTSTRSEKFRLVGHTDAIMWVGASPDGQFIATSSWDSTVKIWDSKDGQLLRTLTGTRGQGWTGRWSPDGKLIAVGSGEASLRVWDVHTGRAVHDFGGGKDKLFSGWVRGVDFGPAGKYLVASSMGGTVRVFDMHSGTCTNHYQIDLGASSLADAFTEIGETLKHAPSGTRFGFKPTDGRLVVYDTAGNEMWEFVQDRGECAIFGSGDFVFARGGGRVYSADMDGKVRVWDLD